jgi:outer membrane protein assembly factor BamB
VLALDRADGRVLVQREPPATAPLQAAVCTPDGGALLAWEGQLLALAPDGAERWRFAASSAIGHLGLAPGHLLATTRAGLLALDPDTGQLRWRRPGLPASLAPALDADGNAVLVTLDGQVVGIDPAGERRFELTVERRGVLDAPALGPGRAYLTAGRCLLAIR